MYIDYTRSFRVGILDFPSAETVANMAQSRIDDYLFHETPYRRMGDEYEITLCESSILYKVVRSLVGRERRRKKIKEKYVNDNYEGRDDDGGDVRAVTESVLEGDDLLTRLIKRNVSYAACIRDGVDPDKHVCDAHMIMIGGELERKITRRLSDMLPDAGDTLRVDPTKRAVLKGAYISHGCLYYSVFREVNNNTICYEMGMNKEITFYLYDKEFNRGHKFFLKESDSSDDVSFELLCNNRDGKIIEMTHRDALAVYYEKCTHREWHRHVSPDLSLQIDYMSRVRDYSRSVDSHKNKRYLCYAQSIQICLDKLNVFEGNVIDSCRQLFMRGVTFWGISHTLNYEPSKSEHNKNYNKRMMMIKMKDGNERNALGGGGGGGGGGGFPSNKRRKLSRGRATAVAERGDGGADDEMGSAEHKNGIMYTFPSNKENSSSLFVQLGHSHFHNLRELQMTAQKLRVKHVYAVSARNVAKDSFGYICCKYVGNIGTAGKNMLFADGVEISYGHEDLVGIKVLLALSRDPDGLFDPENANDDALVVVLNNIITKYAVPAKAASSPRTRVKIIKIIKAAYEFAEVLFWTDEIKSDIRSAARRRHRNFLCVNITPGVPFRKFAGLRAFDLHDAYLSRTELEQFYVSVVRGDDAGPLKDASEIVEATNEFLYESIDRREIECCSALARKVGHKTEFTLPAKRAVAVNAYKSSLPDRAYITLARMTNKNVQIFVDPAAFERDELRKNGRSTNRFELIRRAAFDGKRLDGESPSNMYYFNTAFGDVDGINVEDAYVLDKNVNLHLWCVLSYSLAFEEPEGRVAVVLPSIFRNVCVTSRNADGEPFRVVVLMATIYSENDIAFPAFRNVRIYKSRDKKMNAYVVYAVVSEEILVSSVIRCEKEGRPPHSAFSGVSLETERFEHFKPNSGDSTRAGPRVYYRRLDFVGVFKSRHFNGIKIVNSFGQKGLATVDTDLSGPTALKTVEGPDDEPGDSVNLIANNCSLISRCASGQLLQMKQNFPCAVKVDGGSKTRGTVGRVPFFVTDNLPSLSIAPMRFDELQKTTYVANSLPLALNVRANYNINNVRGLCYPKDSRHVLNLYESIINSSFRMYKFDEPIYTTAEDVRTISEIYDEYRKTCEALTKCSKRKGTI